jgi:hypothetical protein
MSEMVYDNQKVYLQLKYQKNKKIVMTRNVYFSITVKTLQ